MDQETIMTLITKQLEIGKPAGQNEFMQAMENILEDLFIERTFQMKNVISHPDKINDDENEFQLMSGAESLKPQGNVKKNCHLLTKQNGHTIWMKSKGSVKKIDWGSTARNLIARQSFARHFWQEINCSTQNLSTARIRLS
jgi:hypothetical protein